MVVFDLCPHLLRFGPGFDLCPLPRFGPGSGRVWLDGVTCTGREDSINECQHPPFGGNSCDHTLDVGVVCYRKFN